MISVKKMVLVPYEEPKDTTNNSGLSNEIIVHSIPKSFQNKARTILEYIKGPVTWNDKGEVSFEGQNYPGMHIREYEKSPPNGYQEFQTILERVNIPKGLIQQQKTFLPHIKVSAQKMHKGWLKI